MNKLVELIKLLEKLFGKGAVSRTIGTRTNVVRFPKGKQPVDPTTGEFRIEELKGENPDSYQVIKNSIEDRMGDITKMNDSELLNYTANVRRMVNAEFPPPLPEADIVKFGSGQEIKGKGLEELIEKQGTKNPPTTVAGDLETAGKRLEKTGEDLKEITEPRSLVGDMLKDYADFNKYMQSSQRSGYVRATVRQIMREDIQAGKLKLPKELQDQVMQGLGEPIDIYRKVYGEGALEQIDSLADDLGQFRTEEEAAKFARSKYQIEPKAEPVDESKTYEELEDIFKKGTDEPEGKTDGGIIGYANGGRIGFQEGGNTRFAEGYKPEQISFDDWLREKISGGSDKYGYLKNIFKKYGYNLADALDLLYKYEIEHPKNLAEDPNYTINRLDGEDFYKMQFKNLEESGAAAQQNPEQEKYMLEQGYDAILKNYGLLDSTPEVPTIDPFSGEPVSAQDQSSFVRVGGESPEDWLKRNPGYIVSNILPDIGGVPYFEAYKPEIPTVDPFSGEQVSAQDQAAFTQPQAEIFPQQELPTVTPEAPFQPYQSTPTKTGIENLYGGDVINQLQNKYFSDSGLPGGEGIVSDLRHATATSQLRDRIAEFAALPISTFNPDYKPGPIAQLVGNVGAQGAGLINEINPFSSPSFIPPIVQYPSASLEDLRANYVGATQVPYGQTPTQTYDLLKSQVTPFTPNVEAAEALKSRYNQYLSAAAPGGSDVLYSQFKKNLESKADGGRIGFNKGKKVMSQIDKLIEQLNKKTKGKKSMESVNPKTGEVTTPKRPIRRAEEPTGITTMDIEPEIVDEKSITKTQQKTKVKKYDDDIIKAADEIYPSYDDPKIAADQIVDSYAQMKYGLEDQYGLSNKERMDLYTQAYDYVMDHNRKIKSIYKKGDPITEENFSSTPFAPSQETLDNLKKAREMTKGMNLEEEMNMILNQYDKSMFIKNEQGMVDVTNPENVQKMALLLKRDFPDLYKRLEGETSTNVLEDFDITGREPNANGGIAGLL